MKIKLILFGIIIFSAILRLVWLDRIPPSLYSDEINQGYNAYSIMLTGRDEYGAFLPVSLRSFGDWKPPLQTYFMIPFIYSLGLNEWSVRLPGAICGILSVIVAFYFCLELFFLRKSRISIALLSSFFVAISPWHILQSRSAMLVIVSLLFLQLGVLFLLKALKKSGYLSLSAVFFIISVYSYYGMRVIVPLLVIIMAIYYSKKLFSNFRVLIIPLVISFICLLPLIISFIKQPDVLFGRAKTVSVFYDQGVKLRQWELISQDGINAIPLVTRFFHNNVYMYGQNIVRRFLSHFDGNFLYFQGDKAIPFQIPDMGVLYITDLAFFIIGLVSLFIVYNKEKMVIIPWLLISIIPAAFTFMTPSANRTFNAVIPFMILISIGLLMVLKKIHNKLALTIIVLLYIVNFGYFLNRYFLILPYKYADWWNYGWKETAQYISGVYDKYDNVVVLERNGMPYVYFLFYSRYDPILYQNEAIRPYVSDNFGYEHVDSFGKYIFIRDREWKDLRQNRLNNSLYVVPAKDSTVFDPVLYKITYPDGKLFVSIIGDEK